MQCAQIRKMLINYALEDARVTERLCVEVHTSHCRACNNELEDLCELVAACDSALSHPAPSDDFLALMERIEAEATPLREFPRRSRWSWRSVATRAAAVAMVGAAIMATAPVARNAGYVMKEIQEVTSDSDGSPTTLQVPIASEAFVKRALDIKKAGHEATVYSLPAIGSTLPLP